MHSVDKLLGSSQIKITTREQISMQKSRNPEKEDKKIHVKQREMLFILEEMISHKSFKPKLTQ